jgi:hypothetical protein
VNHLENSKSVASLVATGNSQAAGTVALTVDTIGYDYLSVDAVYSTCVAGSAVASIFTLRAGDTVASLADYTPTYGAVSGVTSSANTSSAQTSRPTVVRLDFDLRGKPRYISVATAPNDTAARALLVGRLGKGEAGPESAAQKGVLLKFSK